MMARRGWNALIQVRGNTLHDISLIQSYTEILLAQAPVSPVHSVLR